MEDEEWRAVANYEGLYDVSSLGRIRRNEMVTRHGHRRKGGIRRQPFNKDGYRIITLNKDGKKLTRQVHKIVAEAFLGPCPNGMVVCHNNGDPADNRVANLRYGTHAENIADKTVHGTCYQSNKTHCPRGHRLEAPNLSAYAATLGHRNCLSCHRAHGLIYRREHLIPMFDQIADDYYQKIMKGAV